MIYKIKFLGSVVGSFLRREYTLTAEVNETDRETIIVQALYRGRNSLREKFYNISWNTIIIKEIN
jgi:hypothetical protein